MATHSLRQKGRQPHKEKICEICGDIGYEKDIITYHGCKDVDVHRYCMMGYFVAAPVNWHCEICNTSKRVISSSRGSKNEYSVGSKLHVSAEICQSTLPPKNRIKFPGGHGINWEKEVQTGKMKYLHVEEALSLSSSVKKNGRPPKKIVSSGVVTRGNLTRPQIPNSIPEKIEVQYSLGSTGYMRPHNFLNFRTIEPSKKQVQSSKGLGGSTNILELRSPNVVKASEMTNPVTTHPFDPALVHSWKGSFEILGALEFVPKMLNNCIQAHPPSRARRKVYEFSGLLPDTLKFELVPRGDIWTSLFDDHIPGKEDIGLYFLTSEKERSKRYIALVEFMRSKDMVMRMLINDVEMLILASTTLCSDSQKWNNEHFMWGLFYRMGQDTNGCAEEADSNKVIDMEIDMLAGENVGTLDIVVSTTTFHC